MKKLFIFFFGGLFFVLGCGLKIGQNLPSHKILPAHIKKLAVLPFKNESTQIGIEERLADFIINEFIEDGYLRITNPSSADAQIQGKIVSFSKSPLLFDKEEFVTTYKLWINIEFSLYDLKQRKFIWKEEEEDSTTYVPPESSLVQEGVTAETEQEAIDRMLKALAKRVVNRTIEGWLRKER
jgi:hypothetical protein